jgi:hypothetical protein
MGNALEPFFVKQMKGESGLSGLMQCYVMTDCILMPLLR